MCTFSELEKTRRAKCERLRALGINPYPAESFAVTHSCADILQQFSEQTAEEFAAVRIAGRLMTFREMGKASFAHLQDQSGKIQIYCKKDDFDAQTTLYHPYDDVFKKCLDIGDLIGVQGFVFVTKRGEISVHVREFVVLAKALRPLPIVKEKDGEVFDAFTDTELRYRQRYVDLIVTPRTREVFKKRFAIFRTIREYFDSFGYLEVETPILQPIPGGANARPFVTHHNALDIPLYLRIANELYLKRLIVGGFEGVYEFAKVFRNEGIDRTHNPEFTGMELYVAYKDYLWMMEFVENLFVKIARVLDGKTTVVVGQNEIDFSPPFARIPMYDAIRDHVGVDVQGMGESQMRQLCADHDVQVDPDCSKAKCVDALFSAKCEHHYIQPTFIIDHPIELSPLTKKHRSKHGVVERFELYVNGKEIANAYSELTDPVDQQARFEEQFAHRQRGDEESMFIDTDFIRALEYGMPPTAGVGIGMDRVAMLFTNSTSIQDVLFFPQMRPEK